MSFTLPLQNPSPPSQPPQKPVPPSEPPKNPPSGGRGAGPTLKLQERLQDSYDVLKKSIGTPYEGLPIDLLNRADCVVVYPAVKKVAVGIGSGYGRGVIVCRSGRNFNGPWGAPAMVKLGGSSFSMQIDGQATDFILLVMNERGANSVLSGKARLGADASAVAGPVGRTANAETDSVMRADILSYSGQHGVFGGVSLEGSAIGFDDDANQELYGRELSAKEIARDGVVKTPDAGQPLIQFLNRISPKSAKSGKF